MHNHGNGHLMSAERCVCDVSNEVLVEVIVAPIVQFRCNADAFFIQHIGIERHTFMQKASAHHGLQHRQQCLVTNLCREVANMIKRSEVHIIADPHLIAFRMFCAGHTSTQIALGTHSGGYLERAPGGLQCVVDDGGFAHAAYHATYAAITLAGHEPNTQWHFNGRKPPLVGMLTHIAVQR